MKKSVKSIFKYVLEFLIVAFGVFLGIYASEIQNDKKIKREKEKSISYIIDELENNKERLKNAVDYHQSIKPEVDSIIKNISKAEVFSIYLYNKSFRHGEIKGWTGIGKAELENTAFESAKINGIISEYDMELIRMISKIYNRQELYADFSKSILDKMIDMDASTKVIDVIGIIQLMTTDLLGMEKQLLEATEKVQKEIKVLQEK